MEDSDANDSDEVVRSEDETRRLVEELEGKLKRHERIINNLKIIGPGMSGNTDEGFDYEQ
jgi:hypothetical protein